MSRRNPLVGFTREEWKRLPTPTRAEATFRSPAYERMWRDALTRTGIKFRVYVGYPWEQMPEFRKNMRAIDRAAKKNGEIVLVVGMTPDYIREESRTGVRGTPRRLSRPTPFMLLHNLAEDVFYKFGENYEVADIDPSLVDTWAGRHGALTDKFNGMADLFAKYVVTGKLAYSGPNAFHAQLVIDDILDYLAANPGIYAVTLSNTNQYDEAVSVPMNKYDFRMLEGL